GTGPVGLIQFSPDGRLVGTVGRQALDLWEVGTGRLVYHRPASETFVGSVYDSFASSIAFSPDGQSLATGLLDSTVLLWAVTGENPNQKRQANHLNADDLDRFWSHLAEVDGARAHAAVWGLIACPQQAVPLLRDRLRQVPVISSNALQQAVNDLDSNQFARRDAAAKLLDQHSGEAECLLREAERMNPSAEKRRRIEKLLAAPFVVRSPATLRSLRAVQILEQIGTSEAREVLKKLAQGSLDSRLTREARASLK